MGGQISIFNWKKMATVCVLSGAALGLSSTLYANAIRKTYLLRPPWRHLGGIVGGGLFGYYYHKLDQREDAKMAAIGKKYREMYGALDNPLLVQPPYLRTSAESKESSSDE